MTDIFEKLDERRLQQPKPEKIPPVNLKLQSAGRLLTWLTCHWHKDTISLREILCFGPRPRSWKEAASQAEDLTRRGWLLPVPAHRHDRKVWLIIRENEQMDVRRANRTAELTPNR